jgi:alkylated DNA repair dioxygenase AlkB
VPGFRYTGGVVGEDEMRRLLEAFEGLAWSAVVMHDVTAKRRVAHFGRGYSFRTRRLAPGPEIPAWLLPLREQAAAVAGLPAATLEEALVTEYPPGAGIGWHRDAPGFGVVIGVSLGAACRMRFRKRDGERWITAEQILAPGSAYVLDGPARDEWQHGIPPVKARRCSVTFRTVR